MDEEREESFLAVWKRAPTCRKADSDEAAQSQLDPSHPPDKPSRSERCPFVNRPKVKRVGPPALTSASMGTDITPSDYNFLRSWARHLVGHHLRRMSSKRTLGRASIASPWISTREGNPFRRRQDVKRR
ncbi:hypothetical protein RB195_005024 [Necator americanus]|uniref:Uncharacterized protein n=1 Tax=Necator americanus TaxID=51031 RepID=A0ABR1BMF0_NECAM